MPYRLKPGVPVVLVKDRHGKINYHYARPATKGRDFGPIIPWLSDGQAEYLLRIGYVERIDDQPRTDVAQPSGQDRVNALIATLDKLEVPADAGAPTAREALRDAGHSAPNDLIAACVKIRRTAHVR